MVSIETWCEKHVSNCASIMPHLGALFRPPSSAPAAPAEDLREAPPPPETPPPPLPGSLPESDSRKRQKGHTSDRDSGRGRTVVMSVRETLMKKNIVRKNDVVIGLTIRPDKIQACNPESA